LSLLGMSASVLRFRRVGTDQQEAKAKVWEVGRLYFQSKVNGAIWTLLVAYLQHWTLILQLRPQTELSSPNYPQVFFMSTFFEYISVS
jgi:hypothetical protein